MEEITMERSCTNCVFIGYNAGKDIKEGDGIVIIGDDISSLDHNQEDVVFIGDKIAVGRTIFGKPCNLQAIINQAVTLGVEEEPINEEIQEG